VKPHHEHEFEAAPGLPEALPAGEHILWQGSPDWKMLAVDAFHVKRLAIYFSLMIALHAVMIWDGSLGLLANLSELSVGAILASIALSLLVLTAWLSASTTMYTITNRRVVMRIGIVLTLTFNLPHRWIKTAQIRDQGEGYGEIALELKGDDRIAYLHLWPHARAWHISQPQPALRCIANAKEVGTLLHEAWEKRMAEVAATPDLREARIPVRMPDGVFAR
jgi:hypothetical protein